MGSMKHRVSFAVAGRESRNKPVAGPAVPDVEEEILSAETGPATDAEVESGAQTSKHWHEPSGFGHGHHSCVKHLAEHTSRYLFALLVHGMFYLNHKGAICTISHPLRKGEKGRDWVIEGARKAAHSP